jgi:hypothetical protein
MNFITHLKGKLWKENSLFKSHPLLTGVTFDNDVAQTQTVTQTNVLDDRDAVLVTQTNTPVQT